jgi:hypothetical protein
MVQGPPSQDLEEEQREVPGTLLGGHDPHSKVRSDCVELQAAWRCVEKAWRSSPNC